MSFKLTIPAYIQPLILRDLAGLRDPWGYGEAEDPEFQTLTFEADQLEAVEAGLAGYDAFMLDRLRSEKIALLADLRWRKVQTMPSYDGATDVPADTARSVVTSKVLAAQFLTPEQQAEAEKFKLKPGEWRLWNIADLVQYGLAIGVYMQRCFNHEEDLERLILESEDPASIDITQGWPS